MLDPHPAGSLSRTDRLGRLAHEGAARYTHEPGTGYTPRAGPPGIPRNEVTRNARRLTPQRIDRRRADIHAGTPGPAEEQSCAARLAGDHNPQFPPRARRNRKRIRRATIGRP